MYSRWTTLPLILIPAFGLISCSQDKPEDSWKLSEPILRVDGNSLGIPVSSAPASLEANVVLVFQKDDLKDVTLEFTSACGNHQDKVEVSGIHEIPLASLWPRSAWQSLDAKRFAELECTVSAIAKNRNGSTHKFRLNTRRLTNATSLVAAEGNALIKATGARIRPQKLIAASSDEYEVESDESLPREVALNCENFTNLRVYPAYETAKGALKDLASEQIIDPLLRVSSQIETDPRQKKTLQRCTLVRRTQNLTTGLPTYVSTPEFIMEFPHPAAEVTTRPAARYADQDSMHDQTLYSFELRNTSDRTLRYRVPINLGSTVKLNAIVNPTDPKTFQPRKGMARTRVIEEATYVSIEGGQVHPRLNDFILDLPAKSISTLHLKMKSLKTCLVMFHWKTPVIPIETAIRFWTLAGFEISFAKPIAIEQVRDFSGSEGLDQAQFIEIPLITNEENERGMWQTHEMWVRKTGSDAKPEVTETIVNPLLEGSFCVREGINVFNQDPANFF